MNDLSSYISNEKCSFSHAKEGTQYNIVCVWVRMDIPQLILIKSLTSIDPNNVLNHEELYNS